MRRDSRLSRMLHVLIHMEQHGGRATSEVIGCMLGTNPVVVRRTMAGLREHAIVRSEKGHGGGWTLVRPLAEISMLDIYHALGEPALFAIGPASDTPDCLVEQAVDAALGDALRAAAAQLRARLAETSVADLARDFEHRYAAVTGTNRATVDGRVERPADAPWSCVAEGERIAPTPEPSHGTV